MSVQTATRVMLALDCIPLSITTKLPQDCQVGEVSATNKRGHSDQNWIWSASTVFLYNEDPWRYQESHNENPLGTLIDGGESRWTQKGEGRYGNRVRCEHIWSVEAHLPACLSLWISSWRQQFGVSSVNSDLAAPLCLTH